MRLKELQDYYGTWAELTRQLRFPSSSAHNWIRRGSIPYDAQLVIEKRSKGRFKADENDDHRLTCRATGHAVRTSKTLQHK